MMEPPSSSSATATAAYRKRPSSPDSDDDEAKQPCLFGGPPCNPWSRNRKNNKNRRSAHDSSSQNGDVLLKPSNLLPPSVIRSPTAISPSDGTDDLIAKEMNLLSLEDRQQAYEDLHAIPTVPPEDPVLIARLLDQLEAAAANLFRKKEKHLRAAFDRAMFLRPSYVKTFRMPFLRGTLKYDMKETVYRYVSHFRIKQELFGEDSLVRDIRYSDLSEEDRKVLNGAHQILRDTGGRLVICGVSTMLEYKEPENFFRILWYMMMRELRDEDTQRKGVVLHASVNTAGNSTTMWNMDYYKKVGNVVEAMPLRVAGVHFCWNDARWRPVLALTQLMVGDKGRVRFRSHYGSPLETQYELLSYGIPAPGYEWPIQADGTIQTTQFEAYLRQALQQDDAEAMAESNPCFVHPGTKTRIVLAPTSKDILFGIGRPYHEYPGNVTFLRSLEQDHLAAYLKLSSQEEKTKYNSQIVKEFMANGHRFLKRVSNEDCLEYGLEIGCWIQVHEDEARSKVSRTFRNIKFASNKKAAAAAAAATATAVTGFSDPENHEVGYEV